MEKPDVRSLLIIPGHAYQDEDPALLMRVLVGQAPGDASLDDGHIIAVDQKTASDLEANGQALRIFQTGRVCGFGGGRVTYHAGPNLARRRNMEKYRLRG